MACYYEIVIIYKIKNDNPSAKYWGITVDMSLYGNTKDKRLVSFQKQPLCDIVLFPLFPLFK